MMTRTPPRPTPGLRGDYGHGDDTYRVHDVLGRIHVEHFTVTARDRDGAPQAWEPCSVCGVVVAEIRDEDYSAPDTTPRIKALERANREIERRRGRL
jgi:hypothetical protein